MVLTSVFLLCGSLILTPALTNIVGHEGQTLADASVVFQIAAIVVSTLLIMFFSTRLCKGACACGATSLAIEAKEERVAGQFSLAQAADDPRGNLAEGNAIPSVTQRVENSRMGFPRANIR